MNSKMPQNDTKPRFTKGQLRVLQEAQEAGIDRTITKVCEDAEVNRRTFYRWLDKPHFAKAWDEVWRGSIIRHFPSVIAAQLQKARRGDTAAARLVADLAGKVTKKQEISGPQGSPIPVRMIQVIAGDSRDSRTESGSTEVLEQPEEDEGAVRGEGQREDGGRGAGGAEDD